MVILEAMAAGTPVIATAVGGIPDTLTDEEGMLVAPRNVDALATAIIRMAQDPQLGSALATRAYSRALRTHARDQVRSRLHKLYEEVSREAEARG